MAGCILNHIALTAADPERLRAFYTRWFGFEELRRTDDGSIYLTDGHFNLGLLQQGGAAWEDRPTRGPHHIGFTVDSVAEIEGRLEEFYPDVVIERRPPEDPYSQFRLHDPEKNVVIDLSEKGYGVDPTAKGRVPRIVHIATLNHDMPAQFKFWQTVFGLADANRTDAEVEEDIVRTLGEEGRKWRSADDAPFVGDGFMNLAVLPYRAGRTTGCEGKGFDHFGMLCRDPRGTARTVLAAEPGTVALDRPADRQTEHRLVDPEGNHFDMSEKKGWKVAPGVWANLREESAAAV
jgi:catechol 2,3-dioxygenase-like lactoylglutathione lyase family enzyme